jgi:hypothetical protein
MSSNWRRFEVLLPSQFNDGRDVPDSSQNRAWMREFKSRWKAKTEQLELWVVSYQIEIE